ncbi:hypothetical protein [Poseidonibacter ostreae]|jgi:hypothetical protein|uniref:Uncharacterized protein n=1 Tax=Poseidonibacter ostreae TaxID=2654171 RepID=A0ABQ6VH83_9BACT|nr:hypothetical protein [Poseidonibacter ostreae]KAB7886089.1 hypothetical protein GBG18_14815 [Poseidonibacter ostreae]
MILNDNLLVLIVWIFLFIIPSSVGGLFMMMLSSFFLKNKTFKKQLLYESLIAIIFSSFIYPALFFMGMMNVSLLVYVLIALFYLIINIKMFYSNDWKKYP